MVYTVCVMPIGFILFYPGTDALQRYSDAVGGFSIFILYLIHGLAMKFLLKNLTHIND
jgi:hypothetical protein